MERQTKVQRKLDIDQLKPHQWPYMISWAPERFVVHAATVTWGRSHML